MDDILALQNGSDIRGIAMTTDEFKANLTPIQAMMVAQGILNWYADKIGQIPTKLTIGLGCDSRLTGPSLKQAMIDTFIDYGVEVIDFGMATTPAMFMATQFEQFACDISVMLTASHLPYYYNGIKIFTNQGGVEKADIQNILAISQSKVSYSLSQGTTHLEDLITPYARF